MSLEPEEERYPLDKIHLDELLQHVVDSRGLALVLEVDKPPSVDVDGAVEPIIRLDVTPIIIYEKLRAPVLQRMVYDILTDEEIKSFEAGKELDFGYSTADATARFRAHIFLQRDQRDQIAAEFLLLWPPYAV